jgi:hypothetical protein
VAILAVAEEADADLVVVGSQATNKVTHTRAGSTAFQLLQSATRPTLLVPPRARVAASMRVPSAKLAHRPSTSEEECRRPPPRPT